MEIEQTTILIRDAIRDIPKQYNMNAERIRALEKERIDLLHLIELVDLNAREGYKVYKELQSLQKERRKLKDENELLKHVKQSFSNMKGQLKHLDKAIGDIRNEKINLDKRSYRCRSRKDLEKIINEVK
ncbi:hypothetical protein [Oceanobacillus sp. FSL W7-1293]|uniref:hypothetical protein n=1 Tax=Oceanobacillus sp. FSL W7-1293 TaxID=2921699 RepID=UPI0030CF1934